MRPTFRLASALAITAFAGLGAVGCGGNSGTQPTSFTQTLNLTTAVAYSSSAAPVGTVDDTTPSATRAAQSIVPLAVLTTDSGQTAVLWGTRGSDGSVTSVREAAYKDANITLYARYNAAGGLLSVLGAGSDSDTKLNAQAGSYLTFSELEASGNSIVGTGVEYKDGVKGSTGQARATLTDIGVTVTVLNDKAASKVVMPTWAPVATSRADAIDPLAGLTTVYQDSPTRAKIIDAVTKAAGLVVGKPFNEYISRVTGFLLLDQLAKSYTTYTAKGLSVGAAGSDTTPLPYRADLP